MIQSIRLGHSCGTPTHETVGGLGVDLVKLLLVPNIVGLLLLQSKQTHRMKCVIMSIYVFCLASFEAAQQSQVCLFSQSVTAHGLFTDHYSHYSHYDITELKSALLS